MKLVIISLVLDGQPFVQKHLPIFENLNIQWEWRVAEGAANNTHCTTWCSKPEPRISRDGTSEYLTRIAAHKNVRVFRKTLWDGKVEMCNACLRGLNEECIILQRDIDEFMYDGQLETIVSAFQQDPSLMRMYFWCNYFVGPNLVSTTTDGYGNRKGEWLRAFRYRPGMTWDAHEPPILSGNHGRFMSRDETKKLGLVIDHFAWTTPAQVKAKETYYKYENALAKWTNLQRHHTHPIDDLKVYLPWVGPNASADLWSNVHPNRFNPFLKMFA